VAEMARKCLKFLEEESKLLEQSVEYEANALIQNQNSTLKENAYWLGKKRHYDGTTSGC
jgi:hypothetical protein